MEFFFFIFHFRLHLIRGLVLCSATRFPPQAALLLCGLEGLGLPWGSGPVPLQCCLCGGLALVLALALALVLVLALVLILAVALVLALALAVALLLVVVQKAAVGALGVGVLGCTSGCCPCCPRFLTVVSPGRSPWVRTTCWLRSCGTCQLCFLLFGNPEAVKAGGAHSCVAWEPQHSRSASMCPPPVPCPALPSSGVTCHCSRAVGHSLHRHFPLGNQPLLAQICYIRLILKRAPQGRVVLVGPVWPPPLSSTELLH